MKDEIIAEVRRTRDELSAQYGYDVRRIFEVLEKREAESGKSYVVIDDYADGLNREKRTEDLSSTPDPLSPAPETRALPLR